MKTSEDKFKQVDTHVIKKHIEGKGNEKDVQQISEWFSDLWSNEELRKITKDRWNNTPEDISTPSFNEKGILDRIHHIIRLEESTGGQKGRTIETVLRYFQRVAAVILIPLLVVSLFQWNYYRSDHNEISDISIYSPLGTRTDIILPDGSKVWLNGGSRLNFPSRFSEMNRTVELVGEGYFEIKKDPKKEFIVKANELEVKVYGTSFNVMAYPDEQTMEVILAEGTIEVFNQDRNGKTMSLGIMAPGERGILWKGTSIFKSNKVDVYKYTSWKEGKLVFRNEAMDQVVRKLNRWYNVNIVINDNRLKDYYYRATFSDEKLDEVLKIFEQTSPIVFTELGRKIKSDGTYGKRTFEMSFRTDYEITKH